MKIFLDTANLESIKKYNDMGLLDGITTNPSLLSKEGGDPQKTMEEITRIIKGDVSLEVVATDYEGMMEEGRRLRKYGNNAGAKYISPFIGRLDDVGKDGMSLIREIKQIFSNYNFKTQILVASVRHPMHVVDAAKIGADVVTLPPAVLGQMLKHQLTDIGLKNFLADWEKLKSENPDISI